MEFSARIKLDCKIYIKTLSSIYGVGDVDILKVLNKRENSNYPQSASGYSHYEITVKSDV